MPISLKQLNYFIALAEAKSFGLAAARVHVTQPALSQQIKELETNLGVTLLERLPRGVRLTRAGQDLVERARRVQTDVRDMERAARLRQGLSGRLKLGVIPTIAPYLLPRALTRIRARDLTLELRVREAQTSVLLSELADGQIDVAVVSMPVGQPGLVAQPLFDDAFVLAGNAHKLMRWHDQTDALRPVQVPQDQLLLLDEGHCLADQALEVCGMTQQRKLDLGASSLTTLTGLVAQGFGLTLLPEISLRTEATTPGLALMRFGAPEPGRQIALVRRASSSDDGWVDDLAGILKEAGHELITFARTKITIFT